MTNEPSLRDHMEQLARWTSAERVRNGFVWIGTMEADPRSADARVDGWPNRIGWARNADDQLYVSRLDGEWTPVDDAWWRMTFPHTTVPAHLPPEGDHE